MAISSSVFSFQECNTMYWYVKHDFLAKLIVYNVYII